MFQESKQEKTQPREHMKDYKSSRRGIYADKDESL